MTLKKRSSNSSTHSSSPRQSVALTKGDWLDVMDHDGVWNVARVLSVPSPEEVEVMYDGWPEEYDEVVRVESDRVAPFHTFTWAVKCWVKYLNWPLWPSVITIRTPGTEEGIRNLEKENRLYVDFLDDPSFAKRDRCWQKKRQVRKFDDNYDANRMGTNGAQFERALEFALRSDATTKMPKFATGTLPLQYENATTESVEGMRKSMGKELWYRNFANNKQRHMRTHVYEVIGDDEVGAGGGNSAPKLKVRRPKTTKEQQVTPAKQKKKRSLAARKQPIPVKIEEEPLMEVEAPYELDGLGSSDSIDDGDHERKVLLKKKRRKYRSTVSPAASVKESRNERHMISPKETNAATRMPRHVTVSMDEIIVDDDEDSASSVVVDKPKPKERKPRVEVHVKSDQEQSQASRPVPSFRSAVHSGGERNCRQSPNKKRAKMAARRSVPPISEDFSLAASAKPRSTRLPDSDDDSEEEEKAVPRKEAKDVVREKPSPRTFIDARRSEHQEKQTAPNPPKQPKPTKRPKPKTALEQRIALAQDLLRGLDNEKQQAAKRVASQEREKTNGRSSSFSSRGDCEETGRFADRATQESHRLESSGLSFLRPGSESFGSQGIGSSQEDTSIGFGLETEELGHSFLSVDKAYSSDSQESKGIPTPFDEPVAIAHPSEPKEDTHSKNAESKTRKKVKNVAESKEHRAEEKRNSDDDGEEKSQEVRRRFCVMQAGFEGTLEATGKEEKEEENPEDAKRTTLMSMPRKFDASVNDVSKMFDSSTDSMLRKSPPAAIPRDDTDGHVGASASEAVFSSSEGFSMDKWFKRSLVTNLRAGLLN